MIGMVNTITVREYTRMFLKTCTAAFLAFNWICLRSGDKWFFCGISLFPLSSSDWTVCCCCWSGCVSYFFIAPDCGIAIGEKVSSSSAIIQRYSGNPRGNSLLPPAMGITCPSGTTVGQFWRKKYFLRQKLLFFSIKKVGRMCFGKCFWFFYWNHSFFCFKFCTWFRFFVLLLSVTFQNCRVKWCKTV